jgi:membrane-bound metal-dependent hydrolase YbcI (DUF457 family)
LADFRTHLTTSGLLGVAYGAASHLGYEMPVPTALLAGGLVTIGGVLPDLDSDNAIILRESLSLIAVVTPMMLLHRYREWGWSNETIVLASAAAYLVIRFGLGSLVRRYTVHRGMFHSIPAAGIAGLLIYLLCSCTDMQTRMCKTGAIMLGYIWHLVLDEISSFETGEHGRVRIKRSFGTALKFFGKNGWANISAYGKLLLLAFIALTSGPAPLLDLEVLGGPGQQQANQPADPGAVLDPRLAPPGYPLHIYSGPNGDHYPGAFQPPPPVPVRPGYVPPQPVYPPRR